MRVHEILLLKEAVADLESGRRFYDQQEDGVGGYFWDSLMADIESLVIQAGIHRKECGFHRMFAKHFPYAVYYDVSGGNAYVVGVLPVRRDPAWTERRLQGRDQ